MAGAVSLYPNPAEEEFWLEVPGEWGDVAVEIWGMDGRLVKRVAGSGERMVVETRELAAGCYTVAIHAEGRTFHKRLLVSGE